MLTSNTDNSEAEYQVMVIGSISLDQVVLPSRSISKIGGAISYSGLTYLKLGAKTHALSNYDSTSDLLRGKISDLDLNFLSGRGDSTTTFELRLDGDVRTIRMLEASATLTREDFPRDVSPDHIHLGPLHASDVNVDLIKELRHRFPLAVDIQGFVRKRVGDRIVTEAHPNVDDVVRSCEYVKADKEELACVLDALNLDSAEELISAYQVKELLVTEASKGGVVYTNSQTISYRPDIPEVGVDSTGAGDVFFASYLIKRLRDGRDIKESCEFGQSVVTEHLRGNHLDPELLAIGESVSF